MGGSRFPLRSAMFVLFVVVFLALAVPWLLDRHGPDATPGQTWRRGFFGGDQLRLLDDGSYRLQRWSYVGADETYESGTWDRLGGVVSLVPGELGHAPRLMRMQARDGKVFLAETGKGAKREPDAWFERRD